MDKAQPQPRIQVASSTPSTERNSFRLLEEKIPQAGIKSQAGSPNYSYNKKWTPFCEKNQVV
jgi:hypothetical protein